MVSVSSSPLSSCLLQWWTVTWNVSRINPLFPCHSCWECLSRQQKQIRRGGEIQEDKLHLQGCAFQISTSFTQPLWSTLNNRNIFYYSSLFPPNGKKFNKLYVSAFSSSVYYHFRKISMMKFPGVSDHNVFIAQTIAMCPLRFPSWILGGLDSWYELLIFTDFIRYVTAVVTL